MKTLYSAIAGGFGATGAPFETNGVMRTKVVRKPDDIDGDDGFLVLWGGGDISPSLYGQMPGKFTAQNHVPSDRDKAEVALYNRAKELRLPILGICRGAQLACALEGGTLVQDVTNHNGGHHVIHCSNGAMLQTSSVHHQMLYPWNIEHKLLAYAPGLSAHYWGENNEELSFPTKAYQAFSGIHKVKEPEIVYFPQSRCLAIQGHPEFMSPSAMFVHHVNDLIGEYFV